MPSVSEFLRRLRRVGQLIEEGTIKKKEGFPEGTIQKVNGNYKIPPYMLKFNLADLTLAFNEPNAIVCYHHGTPAIVSFDPIVPEQNCRTGIFWENDYVHLYEDEEVWRVLVKILTDLVSSRFPEK